MKPNYIRKLLTSFMVERIYLLPESEWTRKNRIKRGGNKKICFREGWIEFGDKRMAKLAAMTLNSQKMVGKKGNFYSEDVWNLKYLPKFKWHHLTERLAHEERLKRERLKVELEMERKVDDFYSEKMAKSKMINGIVARKLKQGKTAGPSKR
jgi:ESF2/ABP1 family protein